MEVEFPQYRLFHDVCFALPGFRSLVHSSWLRRVASQAFAAGKRLRPAGISVGRGRDLLKALS